ncbi:hypothetical protein L1049_006120 [Liquidambar formosana]|uniref:Intracellular protein transport protein USO1-like protein n=1 Tax=Liquidambar formosana TaxID=63359 RepID=A0AAP0REZ3_LIQFO
MKRAEEEKSEAEKREQRGEGNLGEKLRRRGVLLVGKRVRAGPSTPVPAWRLEAEGPHHHSIGNTTTVKEEPFALPSVSARKLAATLWEFQHDLPFSDKMHRGVSGPPPPPPPRLRRLHKDKGLDLPSYLDDPSPSPPDQPASASSLRRHVAASLMQHHRAIERNHHALQPVSPASYGSSLEVAHYNPAVTPTSSLDFKGRVGESNYSLKTSTELLKVLNRIWSLEEQHASNKSLIKALKMELDRARSRIKELIRDQHVDRHEMDDLMKQIAEDKLVRKSKEQDRISAAVQSVRDELEDERKLRKRSEGLHRKLARELSEVKSSFAIALKELERERNSRELLEDLCDEFARGIKDYEQEVHAVKQKPDKDWAGRADRDRLILHISESWLDERMQMKLREAQSGFAEKNSIVDKLSSEIETFLQAKQAGTSKSTDNLLPRDSKKSRSCRNSLESVPLNEAVSAPQDRDDEDSAGSDSQCFELNKPSNGDFKPHEDEGVECHIEHTVKSNHTHKKLVSSERRKGRNPSSLQVKFEEQMARAMSCNGNRAQVVDTEQGKAEEGNPVEISDPRKFENCEVTGEGIYERKNKHEGTHGSNSNYLIDNLIRSQYLISECGNMHSENDFGEGFLW